MLSYSLSLSLIVNLFSILFYIIISYLSILQGGGESDVVAKNGGGGSGSGSTNTKNTKNKKIMDESISALKTSSTPVQQRSREEEVNFYINAGFVAFVSFFIIAKILTVDFESWRGWTWEEIFLRVPVDNWGSYMGTLNERPILTKGFTSFTVYFLGDWIAQLSEGKSMSNIDRVRVGRSAIAGLIGHGPLSHFWYESCEFFFNNILNWTAWWVFLPKIAVDQLVWGPIWNGTYILILGILKQESLSVCFKNIKETSIPLLVSGLKLWPLAHVITYGLIPIENRLLWVDLVEILWVTILSQQAAKKLSEGDNIDVDIDREEDNQKDN